MGCVAALLDRHCDSPALLIGETHRFSSMSAGPAFRIVCSLREGTKRRGHSRRRHALVLLAGAAIAALASYAPALLHSIISRAIPDADWPSFRLMRRWQYSRCCFFLSAFFCRQTARRNCVVPGLGSMVPIGFCLAESASRLAPLFSLADAARFLNPRLGQNGEVLYEGPLQRSNSLSFYLDKNFFLVNQTPGPFERDAASQTKYLDEHFVLEAWEDSNPIYLIIEQDRVAHWRRLIIDRVHIYRQVTTRGTRVVLSNEL